MLASLFLHYPRSDCWAGVINLKRDEAGEESRDGREREREIRLGKWVANRNRSRLQEIEVAV